MFFDDNIQRDEAKIVDVRDAQSGAPVPWRESKDTFLFKAFPMSAILDRSYFIDIIDQQIEIPRMIVTEERTGSLESDVARSAEDFVPGGF